MAIKCCMYCKPPVRHPGCHDHSRKYIEEKAQHDKDMAAQKMKQSIQAGITNQKYNGINRALRKKGR